MKWSLITGRACVATHWSLIHQVRRRQQLTIHPLRSTSSTYSSVSDAYVLTAFNDLSQLKTKHSHSDIRACVHAWIGQGSEHQFYVPKFYLAEKALFIFFKQIVQLVDGPDGTFNNKRESMYVDILHYANFIWQKMPEKLQSAQKSNIFWTI